MNIEVARESSTRLVNCGMLILITAGYDKGRTITPCAWHVPLSKSPPLLGVALAKKHFSSGLIQKSREFIVNIPEWKLLPQVVACGKTSGRDTDKFKSAGFSAKEAGELRHAPVIEECVGTVECRLRETNEMGDHYFFVGEVTLARARADCFINNCWDTAKVDFIFHLGGNSFFKSCPVS